MSEYNTTQSQKDNIRTIIQKLIADDKRWFIDNLIIVGDKGPYWILNYQQGGRNEFNQLVRGMVVAKPPANFHGDLLSLIKSFPFIRFYNQGEGDAAHVDFSNAEMLEKMDGTMVGAFFPTGDPTKPEFHTRKMMSTHEPDVSRQMTTFQGKDAKFLPTIRPYVDQLKFTQKDVDYTYVFEFLHEISYVLTKYQPHQYGLYLLGARNIKTHQEMNEDELDQTAKRLGANRPRRFVLGNKTSQPDPMFGAERSGAKIATHAEIEKMFQDAAAETPDFEGFVFRDKQSGNRVKVKDPKYVEKHHLLDSLSYKRLIPLLLKGEEEEIVAYFPQAKERIEEIKTAYNKYLNNVVDTVQAWQRSGFVGKELALRIFGPESSAMDKFTKNMSKKFNDVRDVDAIRNGVDAQLKQIALGTGKDGGGGSPKRLIELIGLHDDEEEENNNPNVGEL